MSYLVGVTAKAQELGGKLRGVVGEVEEIISAPGEHIRPHVGPTLKALDNLRAVLAEAVVACENVESVVSEHYRRAEGMVPLEDKPQQGVVAHPKDEVKPATEPGETAQRSIDAARALKGGQR